MNEDPKQVTHLVINVVLRAQGISQPERGDIVSFFLLQLIDHAIACTHAAWKFSNF